MKAVLGIFSLIGLGYGFMYLIAIIGKMIWGL
jgi:hypothetical protein